MSVEDDRPGKGLERPRSALALPETTQEQIRPLLDPGEELRCGAEADMVLPGQFGTSWLVGTHRRIAVFPPNGGVPHRQLDVPLDQAVRLRLRELHGSNLLELQTADGAVPLLRYTDAKAEG